MSAQRKLTALQKIEALLHRQLTGEEMTRLSQATFREGRNHVVWPREALEKFDTNDDWLKKTLGEMPNSWCHRRFLK